MTYYLMQTGVIPADSKRADSERSSSQDTKVQTNIESFLYKHNTTVYAQNSQKRRGMDHKVALYIVNDLVPLNTCNSKYLNDCFQFLDHRYKMPSSETMLVNVLLPLYEVVKHKVKNELRDLE